jgi:NAD(P)-dependent dehydrogenase (short-subunit alcohol dehydrogenase family)
MNSQHIAGKPAPVALITGANRGLGRAAALHLARSGWDLVITYKSGETSAAELVAELQGLGRKAQALQLDTGKPSGFPAFVAAVAAALRDVFGVRSLHALVNNAGHGIDKPFMKTTESEFDDLYNVHLKGVFFLTQQLAPLLADGGSILNVSSGLARFSLQGKAAYAAMKGGVEVLTRYLAVELGPRAIRVNTIAPGAIATDFGGGVVRDNPAVARHVAGVTALGRVGQADDIGAAVDLLLSPASGWINGQRIEVSGGMFL